MYIFTQRTFMLIKLPKLKNIEAWLTIFINSQKTSVGLEFLGYCIK